MYHVPFWSGCDTSNLFTPLSPSNAYDASNTAFLRHHWQLRLGGILAEVHKGPPFSAASHPGGSHSGAWAEAVTAMSAGRELHPLGTDAWLSALNPRVSLLARHGRVHAMSGIAPCSSVHASLRTQPGVCRGFTALDVAGSPETFPLRWLIALCLDIALQLALRALP
jgi:hypothetical protein